MNRKLIFAALIISAIAYAIISKASKPKPIKVDPSFSQYVSGYSNGMQSRNDAIRIELAQSIATDGQKLPDSNALAKLISIKPKAKGSFSLVNDRLISFTPTEALKENTIYTVKVKLDKLIEVDNKHKEFAFQIGTYKQSIKIENVLTETIDDFDITYQRVRGTIQCADIYDTNAAKKIISAVYKGKQIKVKTEFDDKAIHFTIDSISRNESHENILINYDGKAIGAPQTSNQELTISGLKQFNVTAVKVNEGDPQSIDISCSDPLQFSQNLKGLVTLEGVKSYNVAINNNIIHIELPKHIEGTYQLNINKAIRNRAGFPLITDTKESLQFSKAYPKVRFVSGGNILPNSQGLYLPFQAIGVQAIDVRIMQIFENKIPQFLQINDLAGSNELHRVGKVIVRKNILLNTKQDKNEWNTYSLDLNKLFTPSLGSIYRVSIKFDRKQTTWAEPDDNNDSQEAIAIEEEDNDYEYFDDEFDSWEDYENTTTPNDADYYQSVAINKNILASDIGLIYKAGPKHSYAFSTNLISSSVLPNTEFAVYNYQHQLLAEGKSDAEGKYIFASLKDAYLLIAKNGTQRGYLKLKQQKKNNLSKYDIEGVAVENGVNGFLYAERGVWNPGDSIYLNFILENKDAALPENYPIQLIVEDGQGKIILQNTYTQNVNNIYPLHFKTNLSSSTGTYNAQVKVGNKQFLLPLQIEQVKPNRVKMNYTTQDSIIGQNNLSAVLQAQWLTGAVCNSFKANIYATLKPYINYFTKYKDYSFNNKKTVPQFPNETVLFDDNLNTEGKATINFNKLQEGNTLDGIQKINMVTKVFEPSGEFSIDNSFLIYSPYPAYIGAKIVDAEQQLYLNCNQTYSIEAIAVNALQQKVAMPQVRCRVYKYTNAYWWQQWDDDEEASYASRSARIAVFDTTININAGVTKFPYKVSNNESGKYEFIFTDLQGRHSSTLTAFFYSGFAQSNENDNSEAAAQLSFATDKPVYQVGEQIQLTIPNTSDGHALISIENGNDVLSTQWIKTNEGNTQYTFAAAAAMAPNMYIHVSVLRPHLKTVDKLPIRLYGVLPIQIINIETVLAPTLACANSCKPNESLDISISEANGKEMEYTLAIVDEGLLSLTHFKTPIAWERFNAKQALGINTWDLYKDVIGAQANAFQNKLSIGGDGSYEDEYGNKANRFKPVVRFVGPFTLAANSKATHQINIPNYMGSVKVMLVAAHNGAYGSADKSVVVQQDLMLLSTLPNSVASGDELNLPITLFVKNSAIKSVSLQVLGDGLIKTESSMKQVEISNAGEQVVNYKLQVSNAIGISKLKIVAKGGGLSYQEDITIEVKGNNPYINNTEDFSINKLQALTIAPSPKGVANSYTAYLSISSIPDLALEDKLSYLIQYPHGCVEQTTSAAFPQIYVSHLLALSDSEQVAVNKNVQTAIGKLVQFQTSTGGFAYWPGMHEADDYCSVYVTDFLVSAQEYGYEVPAYLLNNALKYNTQQSQLNSINGNAHQEAYRAYVLAKAKQPNYSAMNALQAYTGKSIAATAYLSQAYSLCGEQQVAAQLNKLCSASINNYFETDHSFGSALRDKAIVLSTFQNQNDVRAEELVSIIKDELNKNVYLSTHELSFALNSLCHYYQLKNVGIRAAITVNGRTQVIDTKKSMLKVKLNSMNEAVAITNNGSKLYVKKHERYIPNSNTNTAVQNGVAMKVTYTDMEGHTIDETSIKQGVDFKIKLKIENLSKRNLSNMALVAKLPSGWQVLNNRMYGSEASGTDYIDYKNGAVLIYYGVENGATKEITLCANATYIGKFYLPAFSTENMYKESIHASTSGKQVQVVNALDGV
jgi:alpha-2-macroglobulin